MSRKKSMHAKTSFTTPAVEEIRAEDLSGSPEPEQVLFSRSRTSAIVIMVLAAAMIVGHYLTRIGWMLLVLSAFMLAFGKNLKQFAFYDGFFVIYALDDSGTARKIPFGSVKTWQLKHPFAGPTKLILNLNGGGRLETDSYQFYRLRQALRKAMPDREVRSSTGF